MTDPAHRLARRSAFVLAVLVLTAIGLAVAADLAAQWWALLPPLVLLPGPLVGYLRARRRDNAAAAPDGPAGRR